jgi:hypothetical protein
MLAANGQKRPFLAQNPEVPMPDDMPPSGPLQLIWRTYRPNWYRKEPPLCHRAVVARRVIGEGGKPVLREVGYVSAYDESRLADPKMQNEFWWRARFQLGRLGLRPNEIALIEQALARRVPVSDPATVGIKFKPKRRCR